MTFPNYECINTRSDQSRTRPYAKTIPVLRTGKITSVLGEVKEGFVWLPVRVPTKE